MGLYLYRQASRKQPLPFYGLLYAQVDKYEQEGWELLEYLVAKRV